MSIQHVKNEIRFYYQQGMAPRITTGDAGKFFQEMRHLEVEKSALKEENERLKTQVEELVEALEDIGASWHHASTSREKYLQARARNALSDHRKGDQS